MTRLQGKAAIVTGAARGLGAAIARRLASEGASVLATDVLEDGEGAAQAFPETGGGRIVFRRMDVTDAAGWSAAVAEVERSHGGLDILINNAGVNQRGDIESTSLEVLRSVLEVNLVGPFLGMKAAIPAMRRRGAGAIINIASNITRMIVPVTCPYSASKAALANLTKTTAIHCAQNGYNIRVNSIHPGPHETPMVLSGPPGRGSPNSPHVAKLIDAIPLQRLGLPEEVAATAAFLASDDAAYITAAEIFIDGGLSAI